MSSTESLQFLPIFLSAMAAILAIFYYCFQGLDFFEKHGIHHLKPVPIFGNMASIFFRRKPISKLVTEIYNVHPKAKYVGMYDFMDPVIVIRQPELIKSVTIKNFDNFPDHRTFIEPNQDPMMGNNLAVLPSERWKIVRQAVTPIFTSSKMKNMFKLMSSCAKDFSEFLAKLPPDEQQMDVKDAFTRYTNDIVASCAFGINVDSMRDRNNDFFKFGVQATHFTPMRMLKVFVTRSLPGVARMLNLKIIDEPVANFFKNVVSETIKVRDEGNIQRPDLMQILMDIRGKRGTDKELTIQEITSQAFIFFFGGFDTVSTLMSFVAHHLAIHPEVQKRVQEEVDEAFNDSNGTLTYEAVSGMRYLEAVINEVLRLYPLAAILDRTCRKDFQLPPALPGAKPFTVKAGTNIWIPAFPIQRDSKYFDDPDKFDPDRFLSDEKDIQNSGTYFPFGLGPRMCIGVRFAYLETKVLLCHLLARCDLLRCPKTSEPLKLVKLGFFTLVDGGYWMKVQPRQSSVLNAVGKPWRTSGNPDVDTDNGRNKSEIDND